MLLHTPCLGALNDKQGNIAHRKRSIKVLRRCQIDVWTEGRRAYGFIGALHIWSVHVHDTIIPFASFSFSLTALPVVQTGYRHWFRMMQVDASHLWRAHFVFQYNGAVWPLHVPMCAIHSYPVRNQRHAVSPPWVARFVSVTSQSRIAELVGNENSMNLMACETKALCLRIRPVTSDATFTILAIKGSSALQKRHGRHVVCGRHCHAPTHRLVMMLYMAQFHRLAH